MKVKEKRKRNWHNVFVFIGLFMILISLLIFLRGKDLKGGTLILNCFLLFVSVLLTISSVNVPEEYYVEREFTILKGEFTILKEKVK